MKSPQTVAAVVLVALLLACVPASAEGWCPGPAKRDTAAFTWGIVGMELVFVPSAYLIAVNEGMTTTDNIEMIGAALAPFAVAGLVGALAYCRDWGPAIPAGTHGAFWTGASGALLGAIIDGVDGGDHGFEDAGTTTLVLGLVGAAVGAAHGALNVETTDQQGWWLAPPPAGMMAGIVAEAFYLIGTLGFGSGEPSDQAFYPVFLGGLTAGLVVAYTATLMLKMPSSAAREPDLHLGDFALTLDPLPMQPAIWAPEPSR